MRSKIVVIGLGPGSPDALSVGALKAMHLLRDAKAPIFARTLHHPTLEWLSGEEGISPAVSFDSVYERGDSFDEVYEAIVGDLIDAAASNDLVGYLVPGHPRFGERTVELLASRANGIGITLELIGSESYLDAVVASEIGVTTPVRILDALDLIRRPGNFEREPEQLDPDAWHVIYQVYDRDVASELKLALLEILPPDANVSVIARAGMGPDERRTEIKLCDLDHSDAKFDHLTSVVIGPLARAENFAGWAGLLHIMAALRNPDGGCPWDCEQTPETLRRFLIEEAHEVLDAIDDGDPFAYAEELGDLLLQVVFHAQLARERGHFTMRDVVRSIVSKLVRRHPHVFGDVIAKDADEVLANWSTIKKSEKTDKPRTSILDGVPRSMPALLRAQEISRRAAKAGFEWNSIEGVFAKLDEEVLELREAIRAGDQGPIEDELGDLLFTAVNLARFCNADAEESLRRMLSRFTERFRTIEDYARYNGRTVTDLSQDEMETIWQAAKRE